MGDLLKTMRSSQIFSVSGLPDVAIRKVEPEETGGPQRYEVELRRSRHRSTRRRSRRDHRDGDDVPAWFLDTAWNGLSFHVSQAFFPRTSAGTTSRRRSRREFEESVWDHLAGTISAPFAAGDTREIAVKVIDDRGNELLVVQDRSTRRNERLRGRAADPQLAVRGAEPSTGRSRRARRRSARPGAGGPATSTATRRRRSRSRAQPARGEWQELELVNLIRERLDAVARGRLSGRDADDARPAPALAPRRARAAALLRAARGGRDDHLPDRGAVRPPPGHRRAAGGRARGRRGVHALRLQDGDRLRARRP